MELKSPVDWDKKTNENGDKNSSFQKEKLMKTEYGFFSNNEKALHFPEKHLPQLQNT